MTDQQPQPFEVALARFEGKLDAWSLQQARHEDRLNAHSTKLDQLQTQVTEVATRQSNQTEARRNAPTWPTVASALVAVIMAAMFLASQIYGG